MSWKLPPLNAIRAFEVAARHSSFTRAADELCVTPGAISRQIRALEEYLGKPLFDRNYREVRLSPESRSFADELFVAFARIDQATRSFAGQRLVEKVRVYAPVTFALRWLVPRLGAWHARFPGQEISLVNQGVPPVNLEQAGIDVAIRLAGPSHNMEGERLFDINLTPVCSPAYLAAHPMKRVTDLGKAKLLQSTPRIHDWNSWFDSCRADRPIGYEEQVFESSSMAYEAAASGFGVAIAMRPLVEDDLRSGRLVAPFLHSCSDGNAFHVVYPQTARAHPAVSGFVDWLLEEAGKSHRPEAGRLRAS
ncbi:MAG: LysR family transcriptional regulator [Rhodobacteraceae bacterium]|jgi:LysR family glycine cleavage system transcriptional activator|nr:LysR family transcriptional regulator [Paracoccaceae bacterium]